MRDTSDDGQRLRHELGRRPRPRAAQDSRAAAPACSARPTSCFYANPVRIVRGEGVHLYDADGQAYLDAYNNVPSVGHCHPRVVEAIARQAATLNTHTRYASELILDYAERLLGTYPDGDRPRHVHLHRQRGGRPGAARGALLHRRRGRRHHGQRLPRRDRGRRRDLAQPGPGRPAGPFGLTVAPPTDQAFAHQVRAAIADMNRHGVRLAAFIADSLFSSGRDPAGPGGISPASGGDRARRRGDCTSPTRSSPGSAAPARRCGASSATASCPTWP